MPLNRRDGSYFGTLCALDSLPAALSEDDLTILNLLAQLISFELEADEQQSQREAELRALEDFVAIAAHDLRQPLTALYGRAQLLARRARPGGSASELIPSIESMVVQTRRAIQLSDKLLDVARIETGDFRLDRETFDLVALAQQALEDAQMNAPNHTLLFQAPPSLSFRGDASRLGQVFRNLLDNATKYSPAERGAIHFSLDLELGAEESSTIRISVRDNGTGVAEADLPLLFTRMFRTANAKTSGISGSGLGLYITRQIVEAHGGSIRAESATSGGLVVHVTLPL